MATGTAGNSARQLDIQAVHYLRKNVTFADEGTAVVVGRLPANAIVLPSSGIHIVTAFDDTSTIDVGFQGGSSTDDPNGLATALVLTAVKFLALDELAATTNIMQTSSCEIIATVNDGSGMVSAGSAEVVIAFVVDNDG